MGALKALVLSQIAKKNLSRTELVRAIGYTNISKGLRRLDSLLDTGRGTGEFVGKLLTVLEIDHHEYESAVTADTIERENRERWSFEPFIEIMVVRGGMPIIPYAIILARGIVRLEEDLSSLSTDEEISAVLSVINNHIQSSDLLSGVTKKGFRYHRAYDECWSFDNDGHLVDKEYRHVSPKKVELRVGGKTMPISILSGSVHHGGGRNE